MAGIFEVQTEAGTPHNQSAWGGSALQHVTSKKDEPNSEMTAYGHRMTYPVTHTCLSVAIQVHGKKMQPFCHFLNQMF